MTHIIDPDATRQKQSTQPLLPFDGGDLDRSGIRLTRAEFARFLEVSKQAVTDWVKSGKVTLGADGRLDPRQAVSQLMRNTDPARLRSKVLAPLVKDVGMYQRRAAELEQALDLANSNEKFAEDSAQELLALLEGLEFRFRLEWAQLRTIDGAAALAAISEWIAATMKYGGAFEREILGGSDDAGDLLGLGHLVAPVNLEGGVGDDDLVIQFIEKLEGTK